MYDVGDVVPLGITVTDANDVPSDAGAVVLTIGLPDGTTTTPSVNHVVASGEYTVDFTATMEGLHTVSWVATGANATAYRDVFNVREITEQILSLAQAKLQLGLTTATHEDDLRMFIAAAGIAVEDHIGKKLVRRTIASERHYGVCGTLILNRAPVRALTSVSTLDGATSWNVADLDVDEDTGIVTSLAGPRLYGNLKATYMCGMQVIRANHLLAVRIITEHLWQTMRPFVGAGALTNAAMDDSLDARAGGLVGFAIPNRALELLGKPPPLVA